jgi:hypothetical protein
LFIRDFFYEAKGTCFDLLSWFIFFSLYFSFRNIIDLWWFRIFYWTTRIEIRHCLKSTFFEYLFDKHFRALDLISRCTCSFIQVIILIVYWGFHNALLVFSSAITKVLWGDSIWTHYYVLLSWLIWLLSFFSATAYWFYFLKYIHYYLKYDRCSSYNNCKIS